MSAVDAQEAAYAALADFIKSDDFTCLGGRAALKKSTVVHRNYDELGLEKSALEQHEDLLEFLKTFEPSDRSFVTFVATFEQPGLMDERTYESLVWTHLQEMHERDRQDFGWDPKYDSDPKSDNFAFCVGGHPFFVVGLHPGASRPGRRFSKPALVFNSHVQFDALGINFFKLKSKIRKRERAVHGSVNPSFIKYRDEARHYGGRFTEPEWKCPFTPGVGEPGQPPVA